MAFDVKRMERDILETVNNLGRIRFGIGGEHPLTPKYPSTEDRERLTVVLGYLVEERYLFPFFGPDGDEYRYYARGITPKGLNRLQRLKHPIPTWFKDNWFAAIVAVMTVLIGIASIVSDWMRS